MVGGGHAGRWADERAHALGWLGKPQRSPHVHCMRGILCNWLGSSAQAPSVPGERCSAACPDGFHVQMFYDDLPIWGFIGKVEKAGEVDKFSLFTHIHFDIQYNGERVIQVDISTGGWVGALHGCAGVLGRQQGQE